jgi:hypothetical protein
MVILPPKDMKMSRVIVVDPRGRVVLWGVRING